MNNNFFTLELDTTGPEIEIFMPNYTLPSIETEIIIQSNEQLSQYQEIYLIDSENKRYDFIFENRGNYLYGSTYFNNIAFGISTIHARLKDDVDNYSNTAIKSFLLYTSGTIKMEINDKSFLQNEKSKIKNTIIKNKIKNSLIDSKIRKFNDIILIRKLNDKVGD